MESVTSGRYIAGTTKLGKELGISRVAAFKRIESGSCKATLVGSQYLIPWVEVVRLKRVFGIKPKDGVYPELSKEVAEPKKK